MAGLTGIKVCLAGGFGFGSRRRGIRGWAALVLPMFFLAAAGHGSPNLPAPPGEEPLGAPSAMAYRLGGANASSSLVEVEGQPFKQAFEIVVQQAPERVHQTALSASNLLPVAKGNVLFMRWFGRSLDDGGGEAEGQIFVQSSKDWSRHLHSQSFRMTPEWQSWNAFFTAPDEYEPGTLFFNIFLGQREQSLAIGGIEIIDCGRGKTIDELRKMIRPRTITSDFEGEFLALEGESAKAKISGSLPAEWRDDSAWADVDVHYERLTANPFEGKAALKATLGRIRSGQAQLRIMNVPVSPPYFVKVSVAMRSSDSIPVRFGIRRVGAPYNYYGSRDVGAGPEWTRHELLVPPVAEDPEACFMIEIPVRGSLEIDAVNIEYLTPDEVAGSLDDSGNLVRASSFPDGLAPPWNPYHEAYRPENYATDPDEIGPTGQPALKIVMSPRQRGLYVGAITTPFFGMGGKYYTFSFWARADTTGHSVNMRMGPPSEQLWIGEFQRVISLGRMWRRFSHTVKLPHAPDGFYLAQMMNWGPAGTVWIDGVQIEAGENAGEFKRGGRVEVLVQPQAPYGLVAAGERFDLRLTVYDEVGEGMTLNSELYDVWGHSYPMPDIPLAAGGVFRGNFTLPEVGQPKLGSYRLEYRVVDKDGGEASKIGEVLLHRVRPAKYMDELRPDSPFGTHITSNSEMPRVARMLGFTWARVFGTHWQAVEPEPGEWSFDGMDGYIENLHEANLCLLGILQGVPVWARSWVMPTPPPKGYNNWHANNVPPKNMDEFERYARRIARQYRGKMQAWETWNEPFLPGFLNEGFQDGRYIHPPPERFMEMHLAAAKGLRAGDPEAKVVFNGGAHYPSPSDVWTRKLFEMGIFETIDAVSYHAYLPSGIGYPDDRIYEATAASADPKNPDREVWNTEGGPGPNAMRNFYRHSAPLGLTDQSAYWGDYLVRYYVSTLASGADKFFYYLMYGWGDYVSSYSLMNIDGRLAPNMTALSNLAWHLEGRKHVKTAELAPGLFANLFEGEGGAVAVALSRGVARAGVSAAPTRVAGRDLFGNDLSYPARLGDLAVYFEGRDMDADSLLAAIAERIIPADSLPVGGAPRSIAAARTTPAAAGAARTASTDESTVSGDEPLPGETLRSRAGDTRGAREKSVPWIPVAAVVVVVIVVIFVLGGRKKTKIPPRTASNVKIKPKKRG